ncbi:L,D-transpeptidase family protein [Methylocystis rosea]|uniref:L,D-transpeptidase family protein n=1 Tax=Methylocystis rosea TaxID=173366 RepID=UPI001AEBD74C|nr:L,D-transpeptidase family protein [Methylocystis rosea]
MKKTPSASRLGFLIGALLSMLATGAPLRAEPATPESPPASAQPAPTPVAPPAPAAPSEPAPVTSAPVTSAPVTSAPPVSAAPQATTPAPAQTAVKKPKPKPAPPRETALSDDPTPALQPQTFFTTSKAADRYRQIVDRGGWPRVGVPLRPGAKGAAVSTLRRRLAAEDDSLIDTAKEKWDADLTAAVKRFQFRLGLKQTGVVAGATLRELDVPSETRFHQLESTAQRLTAFDFAFGPRYIVVNIPSTAVDAVEDDRVVRRYAAIVGDPEHHSPELQAKVVAVNINPTWTVPVSIIKNEIAPKMLKDPTYLQRSHIRVLNAQREEVDPRSINWASERAAQYTLRQDSGADNSLGSIRISMPNSHSVYMHDTPSRNLFANDYRFLSHGCVRVQGVVDLAAWLLDGESGPQMSKDEINAKIASGEREEVRLAQHVPVAWVYMTGWASADGLVHFRDDVYHLDEISGIAEQ